MQCIIDNCNHKRSRRARMGGNCGFTWDEFQICACCHYEIFGDQKYYDPRINRNCSGAIELELNPKQEKKPDQEWINKIRVKRKIKNSMNFDGVKL